jgi:RHS repeat-associated protein
MTARGDAKFTRNWFGRIGRVQRAGMADDVSIYAGESARVMKLSEGGATYYVDPSFEVRDGISIAYTRLGGRTARRMSDAMATQVLSDLAPATAAGTVLTPGGDKHITVADAWLAQAASAGLVTFASGTMPSPVTRLLRASARRALLDDGEAVVHLHADQLGSLVLATGATGAVLAQRSFYPTGLERESTAFVDTYGFTGQEMELASGLLHFGFRDLDPWTGRWDASDPSFAVLDDENAGAMGEATTGYAYVANDTMDHVDPTGLGIGKAFRSLGRKMARSGMLGKGMQTKYKAKRAAKHAAKAHAQMMAALLVAERAARIQAADLDLIRSDPVTKVGLREQLAREFSTENLDFLDAIDRLPPPGDAQEFSALVTLHNTFVRDEVARQVNLPGTIQKPLWEVDLRGAGGTAAYRALLGNARANVHNLIENDSLPRFKKHLRENP